MIDTLAYEARQKDIKLVIAMHDRWAGLPLRRIHLNSFVTSYALGCWITDAYVAGYNLPVMNCENGVPDSSVFYNNSDAVANVGSRRCFTWAFTDIAQYDRQLEHILNYESPNFGVPWRELSDAIFAFEIENEGTNFPWAS